MAEAEVQTTLQGLTWHYVQQLIRYRGSVRQIGFNDIYEESEGVSIRDAIRSQARDRLKDALRGLMKPRTEQQPEDGAIRSQIPEIPLLLALGKAVHIGRGLYDEAVQHEEAAHMRGRQSIAVIPQGSNVFMVDDGRLKPFSAQNMDAFFSGTTTDLVEKDPLDYGKSENDVVVVRIPAQYDEPFLSSVYRLIAYGALGDGGCDILTKTLIGIAFDVNPSDIGLNDEQTRKLLEEMIFGRELSPENVFEATERLDPYALTPNEKKDSEKQRQYSNSAQTEEEELFLYTVGVIFYTYLVKYRDWQGAFNNDSDAAANAIMRMSSAAMSAATRIIGGMVDLPPELLAVLERRLAEKNQ